ELLPRGTRKGRVRSTPKRETLFYEVPLEWLLILRSYLSLRDVTHAIVGEIRFYLEAEIRTNELDEDLVDSGVPAEMLKAMVKAIPEAKLEVGNVAWESSGFDSFEDKHFKDAGFVVGYEDGEPYANYNIPPKKEAL
ncbi:hypothetical protein FOZ63_032945, partial [Perkinsus olseni]